MIRSERRRIRKTGKETKKNEGAIQTYVLTLVVLKSILFTKSKTGLINHISDAA
jgi:hypothetical protein